MHSNSSILIVGNGRLARHLQFWNSLLAKPNKIETWNRTQNLSELSEKIKANSIIWLAISDASIVDFYEKHLLNSGKPILHFSGALHENRMFSAHPLMSFPQDLLPTEVYPQIHFSICGFDSLSQLMPGFTNTYSLIEENFKPLYHALCVLSGNFPQLLWNETLKEFNKNNIPEAAVELYIKQITDNFLKMKSHAITGPISRKDFITIEKNYSALNKNNTLKHIYSVFAEEFSK